MIDIRDAHLEDYSMLCDFILDGKGNHAAERWVRIRDAAVRCFYRSTYPATTIRDIASEAGLTSGALYYYVDTKDDLLFSIIVKVHLDGRVRELSPPIRSESPAEVLRELTRRHTRTTLENWVETAVTTENLRYLSAARLADIRGVRRRREEWVSGLIAEGVTAGELHISVAPELAATSMLSTLNAIPVWYRAGGKWSPDEIIDWYEVLVMRGVLGMRTEQTSEAGVSPREVGGVTNKGNEGADR
jgi:TetR/AcrR family transcriptional regulator, cholesterol catabolism regulator